MNIEIKIDENVPETKIVVYARELTPDIADLLRRLSANDDAKSLVGYAQVGLVLLEPTEIIRMYTDGQRVCAKTAKGEFTLKSRLYELEEMFAGTKLIRISNSEIVNFAYVAGLDLSISGTITLKLTNGEKTYVSRRYMDKIKTKLGI